MDSRLHLLAIYLQESFRAPLLRDLPPAWRVSWTKLDANHPMRFFEPIQLTEPLDGPDGEFLRSVIDDRPDLVLLEMAQEHEPSHSLIHLLKTSAATRRIPILAIGNSEAELLKASQAGADETILTTTWRKTAIDLLSNWETKLNSSGLVLACQGNLHPLAAAGIEAVNAGQFYSAHELLEEAWMAVGETEGFLYRALLQTAVTYWQLQRQNLRGALKMLLRMRQWLDPLPDTCRGVDVFKLRGMMASLRDSLEGVDLDQPAKFRSDWFLPIPLVDSKLDSEPTR